MFTPEGLFQLESILNRTKLGTKHLVGLQSLLHLCATVNDRAMIAIADEFANTRCWHLRVFLRQIHAHLAGRHDVALTRTGVDGRSSYTKVFAHTL